MQISKRVCLLLIYVVLAANWDWDVYRGDCQWAWPDARLLSTPTILHLLTLDRMREPVTTVKYAAVLTLAGSVLLGRVSPTSQLVCRSLLVASWRVGAEQ